jgi:hypothetical protein
VSEMIISIHVGPYAEVVLPRDKLDLLRETTDKVQQEWCFGEVFTWVDGGKK